MLVQSNIAGTFGHPVLDELMKSDFEFFLTGSRLFNQFSHEPSELYNSDWDFMAKYTTKVENFLISLGFKSIDPVYPDSNCRIVLRFLTGTRLNSIDVQLSTDLALRVRAQRLLTCTQAIQEIPKEYHKHLWELALLAAKK